MRRKIVVNADAIEYGVPKNSVLCAVSLAIGPGVHVDYAGFWVETEMREFFSRWTGELPERASRFVRRFDAGRPVKPFSFWLEW